MHAHIKSKNSDLLDLINATGDYDNEIAGKIAAAIEDFKKANGVY